MRRIVLSALFLLVAAGCTPTLNARAVSYHEGPELVGKRFAVVALDGQENDLEFRHYAEIVNRHLHAKGMTQAPSLDNADYRVQFRYGVDGGRQQIVSYPARGYGSVGGFYGGGFRGVGMGYSMPVYGNRVESYTNYTREFTLELLRNDRSRTAVYQGRVTSIGGGSSFSAIASCMIAALFENFPGPSGQEVHVSLPLAACQS